MHRNLVAVCRICLKDGATLPIFSKKETNQVNILTKITICMNEKIEDIEGYPNHICKECDGMLDTFHNFISKFKHSSKLLEERRLNLDRNDNYNNEKNASIEIDLKDIKIEIDNYEDLYSAAEYSKPIKPLNLPDVKIETVPKASKPKCLRSKKKVQNGTNRIASSILEGEFSWTGDKWCVKANQKVLKKKAIVPKKRQREKKLDLPKVTATTESTLCDICGEVFQNRDKLAIHRKNFHLRTPVQCPKCSRMCASTYYLNRHMKRKHETERDFICGICGKGFVFKGELTSHIKSVHEKDQKPKRIFSCKFCTKTYKCPKSIVVHERSVHTGLRPAVCSECGSSFYHIDYLKEHMRLHTGETPFKCPICGRGYAQLCNMKSHLRIHKISELDATTLNKIRPNYLKLLKP